MRSESGFFRSCWEPLVAWMNHFEQSKFTRCEVASSPVQYPRCRELSSCKAGLQMRESANDLDSTFRESIDLSSASRQVLREIETTLDCCGLRDAHSVRVKFLGSYPCMFGQCFTKLRSGTQTIRFCAAVCHQYVAYDTNDRRYCRTKRRTKDCYYRDPQRFTHERTLPKGVGSYAV